jgi:Zn-dependent protease
VFYEPSRTQFDLRFRLFGTAVRVHPLFWVMGAWMGWGNAPKQEGPQFLAHLLIWIACVFVSILVHEMGHVLSGRLFGSDGHIVLYGLGGLAIGSSALDRRWQRIVVYAAGPAAGFLLVGLVWGGVRLSGVKLPEMAATAYDALLWINIAWGLLNLLPVYPLDGGQISRDVCSGLWRDGGVRVSLGISTLVAGLVALHGAGLEWSHGYAKRFAALIKPLGSWSDVLLNVSGLFLAVMFGLLALNSFMTLQQLERQQREWDEHWQD